MPSPSDRPFRILGLQQVAIGGLDKQDLRALWSDLLGVPTHDSFRSEKENVDEDILVLGHGPAAVELDLMVPIDPEGKRRAHDPVLNHIGLWVDDLRAAVAWLEQRGVRFTRGTSARARRGTTCASSTPRAPMPRRAGARACSSSWSRRRPRSSQRPGPRRGAAPHPGPA